MIARARGWSCAVAALVVATAATAQVHGTARGRCYEVTCHGGSSVLAAQALAAVEPVWPLVCAFFGVEDAPPEQPIQVHLYRHDADYLKADRELSGGRFQANRAMSHWDTRSAHVAMQPPCSDRLLTKFGLPLQTQAMLQWEACHVARYTLCRNFRRHPGWFVDGLAATTAATAMSMRHGYEIEQPFFSRRWLQVQQLVTDGEACRVRDLLTDQTQDLDMRDRYAARIVWFEHARDVAPESLRRFAARVRTTTGNRRYRGEIESSALQLLEPLVAGFDAAVAARRPVWDERGRSLWCLGDDWYQVAFPDRSAFAFRYEPVLGGGIEASGAVHILDGEVRQLNFLFACTDEGHYSLAIVAGLGFTLSEYRREGRLQLPLGSGRCAGCKPEVDVPFALRASGRDVTVELAGEPWHFELPQALPDEIRWGIGAQSGGDRSRHGSAGIWRGVQIRPHPH